MPMSKRKFSWHAIIIMACLLLSAAVAAQTVTPPQQFSGNGHWYQFISPFDGWEAAEQWAEARGGYLATATSPEENSFLVSILDQVHSSAYLGGYEPDNNGIWIWVSGETWDWTNWIAGQPDNYGGNENYLSLTESASWGWGGWNDGASVSTAALIEFESEPITGEFCSNFDQDLNGWTIAVNDPQYVTSPTHNYSEGAVRMYSSIASYDCHSAIYATGLSANMGYYSAYVRQENYAAGSAIFIQVQPGTNPNPFYRVGYGLLAHASDAYPPANFALYRYADDGSSQELGHLTTSFPMNEWVRIFIRRYADNMFEFGYEYNEQIYSDTVSDPNPPILAPGAFYLWGCSNYDGTSNYFDDVCYNPMPPDTLCIPSISTCLNGDGTFTVPVKIKNQTEIGGYNIPILFDNTHVTYSGYSLEGTLSEGWTGDDTVFNGSQVAIGFIDGTGANPIPSGTDDVLFSLIFLSNSPINEICEFELFLDTTLTENINYHLAFSDNSIPPQEFVPVVQIDSLHINNYIPGDANHSGGVNILDATTLICYLYKGCPELDCPDAGDAKGDCSINILDVTYLINYLYKGGPAPVCGCVGKGSVSKSNVSYQGSISAEWIDGKSRIVINSTEELIGLEMELTAANSEKVNVINMVKSMQLYHSQNDDKITLAILDIEGRQILAPGGHVVLEIDGPVEIKHVLGSNPHAEAVNLGIIKADKTANLIPEEFSLGQNHPNPFNPITEIGFSLPVACQVSLDIYNIAGQKVASVADGQFEAGNHSVIWDATEQASGIYFYRLRAGEFVETRKMMLLK